MAVLGNKMSTASAAASARCSSKAVHVSRAPVACRASLSSRAGLQQEGTHKAFAGRSLATASIVGRANRRQLVQAVQAYKDGEKLDRPLRVAVVGGGPSGACAAETLAKGGVETYLIERKMDNCKVCVGLVRLSIPPL